MATSSSSGSRSEIVKVNEKEMASSSSSGSKNQIFKVDEKAMASSSSSGSKSQIFKVDEKAMASSSSSSSSALKTVILKCSDGQSFEVDEKVGSQCQAIKHMIEDLDCSNHVIPMANVKGEILSKVLEYCKKHAEYQGIDDSSPAKEELKQWDKEYLDIDLDTLFHVILAANFLAVKDLVDLSLQFVADSVKGKKPHEIREHFKIKNDLPPEKEEQIRKDFYWLDFD